jgi:vacuolar-type H+-ATPase subunit H
MTEEIIKSITEAEAQAVQIKADAQKKAAEIIALADSRAAEIEKSSEEVCKAYRETQLKAAEADAEKKYLETLAEKKAESERYASAVSAKLELPVTKIVGRVTSGDR